jgi:hypothetical protein
MKLPKKVACLLLILAAAQFACAQAPTAPLVQQADMVYKGAFRVPLNTNGSSNFNYGGTAVAYNPANRSLFMIGSDPDQASAEISIPALVNGTSISQLNTATFLQGFADPTEGKLQQINPSDPNPQKVGAQLVYNSKLYLAAYSYYDGGDTQSTSHFVRPLSLSTSGKVQGPYRVGNVSPSFVSGYMGLIPTEWQASFGGPALTGGCCLAIISVQSNGPSAVVFDPANIGMANPVPGTEVLGYPYGHEVGPGENTANGIFDLSTRIRGVVFPAGTRSVLFFGRTGVGPYCYGLGSECGDPAWSYKGTHNYPYVTQVWAYDANDLLAVKSGAKQPYAVQPYATWTLNLPFSASDDDHLIGGAAFDPATKMIYISQLCKDGNCGPIIHAYQLNVQAPSGPLVVPKPPTGVTVQ